MKVYKLQHKNDLAAIVELDDEGRFITKLNILEQELMPLQAWNGVQGLSRWWQQRQVPARQEGIRDVLDQLQIDSTSDFLLKNLGLSLNDCYWLQPLQEDLKWEDVNLFANAFSELGFHSREEMDACNYTPASSTGGELFKRWIVRDGRRMLIKGNRRGASGQQSLNEIFATRVHQKQKFQNHVKYNLISFSLPDSDKVQIGCISENFASEKLEFIPAIQIVESAKKRNDVSWFEHYIALCIQHGIEETDMRSFMDYMILTDYVLTNTDRHFMNFGVLRDADTLCFVRPAPLFDTGNSMFYQNRILPDLEHIEINSFAGTEAKQLKYVHNRICLDPGQLPDDDILEQIYGSDSECAAFLPVIQEGYHKKIEMLQQFLNR